MSAGACRCGSGESYAACCRPFHRGAEPEDAERLLRTRFCAFALGNGEYLWRTLHPDHALRARPRDDVVRELGRARRELRYRSLTVHASETDAARARILFTARVFVRGRDRSFVELSGFERTEEGWRYVEGDVLPAAAFAGTEPTFDRFAQMAGSGIDPGS